MAAVTAADRLVLDASEINEAVGATRRAARRGLLDGEVSRFRIGWARRIRSRASFEVFRVRYRQRYDGACARAGRQLAAGDGQDVATLLPPAAECIAADQAVRAFVNHPAGDLLDDRLATIGYLVDIGAIALARQGSQLERAVALRDLISLPRGGSYLEVELTTLGPAISRLQAAEDPVAELDRLVASGGLDPDAVRLFQGQTTALARALRQIVSSLGGRSPDEVLTRIRRRRQEAHQQRAETLDRLAQVLGPRLTARLRGALLDLDRLSELDNGDDTIRSLAFDGVEDLLIRRALLDALRRAGADVPDDVFDVHQDELLQLARRHV